MFTAALWKGWLSGVLDSQTFACDVGVQWKCAHNKWSHQLHLATS